MSTAFQTAQPGSVTADVRVRTCDTDNFVEQKLKPAVAVARAAGNIEAWSDIARLLHGEPLQSLKTALNSSTPLISLARSGVITADEAVLIKKAILGERNRLRAATEQPKRLGELEEWARNELGPLVAAARVSGDWKPLRRDQWLGSSGRRFAYNFGGNRDGWYGALVRKGLVTSEEVQEIMRTNRKTGARTGAEKKYKHSRKEVAGWIETEVKPAVASARSSGRNEEWAKLRPTDWKDRDKFTSFCSMYGKHPYHWLQALVAANIITAAEESLIRTASRERSGGEISKRKNSKISDEALKEWAHGEVASTLEAARASKSIASWSALRGGKWDEKSLFFTFCNRFDKPGKAWTTALVTTGIITPEEKHKIATSSQRIERKYTERDFEAWVANEIAPLVVQLRSQGRDATWSVLKRINWRAGLPRQMARRTAGATDWSDALVKREVITAEEARSIHSTWNPFKAGAGRLILVERQVAGTPTGAPRDFRPITERILAADQEQAVTLDLVRRTGVRIALETERAREVGKHSDAFALRLALAGINSSAEWDALTERYERLIPALGSFVATRAMISFLVENHSAIGLSALPQSILSVASGPGEFYRAINESSYLLNRKGVKPPEVWDIDYSKEMIASSPNPRKQVGHATKLPYPDDSFDALECSSSYRLGKGQAVAEFLQEASRVVRKDGLLMLKADGILFGGSFEPALKSLGFSLLLPLNTRFKLNEELLSGIDRTTVEKARSALASTHFIIAKKTGEPSKDLPPFCFERVANKDEQAEMIRSYLKHGLTKLSDSELLQNLEEFASVVRLLSDDVAERYRLLCLGVLKHYARALFLDEELPKLPRERTEETTRKFGSGFLSVVEQARDQIGRNSKDAIGRLLESVSGAARGLL